MMGRLLEAQKVTRRLSLSPLPNGPFVAKTPRRNLRGRALAAAEPQVAVSPSDADGTRNG